MFIGTAIAMCTGRTGRNLDLKVNMKLSLVKSINRETNKSGGGEEGESCIQNNGPLYAKCH